MGAWRVATGGVAAASIIVMAGLAAAQSPGSAEGRQYFETYCVSCHGSGGKGDGPFSATLRKRPADLTQLARASKGAFPAADVARLVDGRTRDEAHRKSYMPVWGDVFSKSAAGEDPAVVKARIDAIVKYLSTLQARE